MNIYEPEPRSGRVAFVRNQVILVMRTDLDRTWRVSELYMHLRDCRLTRKQIYQSLHVHPNAFKNVSLGRWKLVPRYMKEHTCP